jgi:hypothetical protein
MSDLCAPIYVVMDADEELTFWCFVEFMNRMVCSVRSFLAAASVIVGTSVEAELPSRPEWHEETAAYTPATDWSYGSRTLQAFW